MSKPGRLIFFLGGQDLEMVTIRELLEATGTSFFDKHLHWGARTSAYRNELRQVLADSGTPVLVELPDDIDLPQDRVIAVDHHNLRAGKDRPTSLQQIFELLGLSERQWTRWYDLVVANDRGYIPALQATGASASEVARVRAADRTAQGITPEEESGGRAAVEKARTLVDERLTVVDLPHNRTAVVTDFMDPALGGPGYRNLLVHCPQETNFFGDGNLIVGLDMRYPGGWYGGALPDRGFWGYPGRLDDIERSLQALLDNTSR